MTDHDSPVTETELHAYADGELPADRREAVETWLARNPEDAARAAGWRAQTEAIRARYGAIAAQPVPERLNLESLRRAGRSWHGIAAAVAVLAFLAGGVAGWMARGASAAAPTASQLFTEHALQAHKLYAVEVRHPVEVSGAEESHLVQWLSKRVGYQLRAPDLQSVGLKLIGGRLLPGPGGAAAFLMYEGGSGERFTLYCGKTEAPQTAMRYQAQDRAGAIYWVDHDVAFVVSGPDHKERLRSVAQNAYDQIEKTTPPGDRSSATQLISRRGS